MGLNEITQHFMGCLSPSEQERMRELSKLIPKPDWVEESCEMTRDDWNKLRTVPQNKPLTHACNRCGSIAVSYQGGMCLSCTLER